MKTKYTFILASALFALTTNVSSQQILNSFCIGSADNEFIHDAKSTSDGGMIAAGYIEAAPGTTSEASYGQKDFWVVKTHANGTIEWKNHFGGSLNDEAFSIAETSLGEFLVAGCSYSSDHDVSDHIGSTESCDIWLLWITENGQLTQSKSYGSNGNEFAKSVAINSQNKINLIAEVTTEAPTIDPILGECDIWIAQMDFNGNIDWQNVYGGTKSDHPYDMLVTPNDDICVIGSSNSFTSSPSDYETYILKVNTNGETEWEQYIFSNSQIGIGTPGKMSYTNEGELLVSFISAVQQDDLNCNAHGSFQYAILDEDGEMIAQHCFGGTGYDTAKAIIKDDDGNFWMIGTTDSNDGDVPAPIGYTDEASNIWIGVADESGQLLTSMNIGGSLTEEAISIFKKPNGQIIVAATTNSSNGDVTGANDLTGNTTDAWLITLDATISALTDVSEKSINIYPNPAKDVIRLEGNLFSGKEKITICDANGKAIAHWQVPMTGQTFDTSGLTPGLYSMQIIGENGNLVSTAKFIKE